MNVQWILVVGCVWAQLSPPVADFKVASIATVSADRSEPQNSIGPSYLSPLANSAAVSPLQRSNVIGNDGFNSGTESDSSQTPNSAQSPEASGSLQSLWKRLPFDLDQFFEPHAQELESNRPQPAGLFNPFIRRFPLTGSGPFTYRLGWSKYDDITVMPVEPVHGVAGSVQSTQWNASVQYAKEFPAGWIATWTGTANSNYLAGPSGVALPGRLDQLATDFELTSTSDGPWNMTFGFTPELASDGLSRFNLNSRACNFDGRAIAYYQSSPALTVALGVSVGNRLTNIVLPNAGLIWIPTDSWEFRLLFPKSQVSYYLGRYEGVPIWGYTSIEYTINTYQMDLEDAAQGKDRNQWSDYRWLVGMNAQYGRFTGFVEGGLVFGRKVRFQEASSDFNIGDGAIVRLGFRF
jgi:hypothetical protein